MSLVLSKRVFMLSPENKLSLLTAATIVERNPVHFVRHEFIFQRFRRQRTELTECRANHLAVTWVLVSAALEADRENRKERDVTHRVGFG